MDLQVDALQYLFIQGEARQLLDQHVAGRQLVNRRGVDQQLLDLLLRGVRPSKLNSGRH